MISFQLDPYMFTKIILKKDLILVKPTFKHLNLYFCNLSYINRLYRTSMYRPKWKFFFTSIILLKYISHFRPTTPLMNKNLCLWNKFGPKDTFKPNLTIQ